MIGKHTEMAYCVRQAVLQAPFQFAQSLYPAVLAIRPFQFFEASNTWFIFKTEISLAKVLISFFTCSMTYSSICSTNHCSGFSGIFLQMKREVDGKSNMLFCYCHREHY